MRVRDRLVDAIVLSGNDRVLDAGCGLGLGLALIACAKKLAGQGCRHRSKPGGRIAIFDLSHTARYADVLRQAGLTVESLGLDWLWLWPCRSLIARKSGAGSLKPATLKA
jgi:hypothetical protein